jgi:hypothetical protein
VADPLADLEISAAIDGGRMNAASALGDLLPLGSSAPASRSGATFDGDVALRVSHHIARGAGSLTASGLGFSGTRIRIAGDVRAVANVARWDLASGTVGGDVAFTATNATGGFDPRPGPPDFVADRVDVRASDAALDLARPSMRGVDYGFHIGRAELRDARALNAFLPSPEILAVESGHALVSADIATSDPDHAARGRLDISLLDGGVRLHQTHLAGDFTLALHARGLDLEQASVDLEGSHLGMRNVRVTGASTDTSAWAGDLVLQAGTLALAPVPKLEGDLTLEARDASPVLAVLFRDTLPSFLAGLTHMPSFAGVTHVVVEPDTLVVSDLAASGGDLAVRGTYVLRTGDRAAAFVVQKGPFSVGVSLDDAGSHLRLFGLDHWYGDRSREALGMRKNASAVRAP